MYTAYRVCFDSDVEQIEVVNMQTLAHSVYANNKQLPEWIQKKVAVLQFVGTDQDVEGVGRMLNKNNYWVHDGVATS